MSYFSMFCLFFILISIFPLGMEASIMIIDPTLISPNSITYEREGIYSKADTPSGNGDSEISWDLLVSVISSSNNISFNNVSQYFTTEVVLIHSSQVNNIFYTTPMYGYQFCCTSDLVIAKQCKTLNRLILGNISLDPNENGHILYYFSNTFIDNTELSQSVEPLVSGIWYLIIANCDIDGERNIDVSGSTIWRSPFGYLPAQLYGNLIVYWILAFMYLIGLCLWLYLMLKYRRNLQKYQHGVTVLITVSFLEELIWGITYICYNNQGNLEFGIAVVAIIFSSGKLTGIRFLLLLMGSGYAITVAKIPIITQVIMVILSICYFITVAADDYISLQTISQTVDASSHFVTTALLVIFNTIFIIWIVWSTLASMKMALIEKNQKYPMYRRLLIIFGVICLICVIVFFVVVGVIFSGMEDSAYQWYWLIDTYWDFIYYSINVYIAYVWKPDEDNQRYAYTVLQEDVDQVELDESTKTSVGGGDTERVEGVTV